MTFDLCHDCNGTNSSCTDCFGLICINGTAVEDVWGVCKGTNTNCLVRNCSCSNDETGMVELLNYASEYNFTIFEDQMIRWSKMERKPRLTSGCWCGNVTRAMPRRGARLSTRSQHKWNFSLFARARNLFFRLNCLTWCGESAPHCNSSVCLSVCLSVCAQIFACWCSRLKSLLVDVWSSSQVLRRQRLSDFIDSIFLVSTMAVLKWTFHVSARICAENI